MLHAGRSECSAALSLLRDAEVRGHIRVCMDLEMDKVNASANGQGRLR